jgi:hypothetical protein
LLEHSSSSKPGVWRCFSFGGFPQATIATVIQCKPTQWPAACLWEPSGTL